MTKVKLFWIGATLATAVSTGVWVVHETIVHEAEEPGEVEPRDCGLTFLPEHLKERIKPECE